jgi:hypothetical protein
MLQPPSSSKAAQQDRNTERVVKRRYTHVPGAMVTSLRLFSNHRPAVLT